MGSKSTRASPRRASCRRPAAVRHRPRRHRGPTRRAPSYGAHRRSAGAHPSNTVPVPGTPKGGIATPVYTSYPCNSPDGIFERLRRMSGAEVAYRLARESAPVVAEVPLHELPPRDAFATDLRFLPPFVSRCSRTLLRPRTGCSQADSASSISTDCDLGIRHSGIAIRLRSARPVRARQGIDYRDERGSGTSSTCGSRTGTWTCHARAGLALTGDPRYAIGVQPQIDSWIEQCPDGRGPELGQFARARHPPHQLEHRLAAPRRLRAPLFADAEGAAFRERWLASIFQHARMIAGNLSRFRRPTTT